MARGDLDAVGEHLAPILRATSAEYRTVPIIGRARSLHALLGRRPNLASATLTTLRNDLAEFVTHPAPTSPGTRHPHLTLSQGYVRSKVAKMAKVAHA